MPKNAKKCKRNLWKLPYVKRKKNVISSLKTLKMWKIRWFVNTLGPKFLFSSTSFGGSLCIQSLQTVGRDEKRFLAAFLGPLHVLWQVSFGCWVTWSISSWQEYYKCVFFPKAEWWVAELLFLSLNTEAWTSCKMNALNPLKFTYHQKTEKNVYFSILQIFEW